MLVLYDLGGSQGVGVRVGSSGSHSVAKVSVRRSCNSAFDARLMYVMKVCVCSGRLEVD